MLIVKKFFDLVHMAFIFRADQSALDRSILAFNSLEENKMLKKNLLAAVAAMITVGSAHAGVITIVGATASNGGDRYANGVPSIFNGSGITKPDANDPSTWSNNGSAYQDELMSWFLEPLNSVDAANPINNKLAWMALDLGSSQALGEMYIFNNNYQNGISGVNRINIYTADSPAVPLPLMPPKNQDSITGAYFQGDYDFASGGWTLFGDGSVAQAGTGIFDMTGVSAQYVAIEVLSNHGDNYRNGRVGFDEIAITSGAAPVPSPTAALAGLIGLGGLMARRRRG